MNKDVEPYNIEDAPGWVKKGSDILAFILLTVAVVVVCGFMFFVLVRFGLWAFGVL